MNLLTYKNNLEDTIKKSHMSSGGMRIAHCSVKVEKDAGIVKVDIALNTGAIGAEAVEELVKTSFASVGLTAFATWEDISYDHSSSTVTRVHAEGTMSAVK